MRKESNPGPNLYIHYGNVEYRAERFTTINN